ncbi:neo-calmodulin-like [Drosophila pseudoobscura]|uniref:Neo-calmodulin-like n=1 Tax=Drosophila pseudoobscura pseudoobscura TaxID=46245 RepID=A0A6I8V4N0_DROPS|nr:neo-calmodulin [Drosophila pseudoobscura]
MDTGEISLSPEQIKEIREAFAVYDRDNTGAITCRELGVVMRSLGQTPTEAELYDMIEEIDADNNGTIEFVEFLQMMSKNYQVLNKDESVRAAFEVFDRDADGFISAQEMKAVILSLGEKVNDQEFDEMFREVDLDNDGQLSFDEFLYAYRN